MCHQKEDEERGVTTKCAMKAFCTEFELDESKHEAERDKLFFAGEREAKRQGRTQQHTAESCAGVSVLQIVKVRTFEHVASVPARQTRTVESTEMVSGRVRVFRSFFFCRRRLFTKSSLMEKYISFSQASSGGAPFFGGLCTWPVWSESASPSMKPCEIIGKARACNTWSGT